MMQGNGFSARAKGVLGRTAALPILSALACAPATALAQDQAPAAAAADEDPRTEAPRNEEIVVTASKRGNVYIQDIPYNISAVGGEQLEKTGATNLEDISRLVPGIATTGGRSNRTVIIRGLAASAGAPQVAIYLDETPLSGVGGINVRQSDLGLYDIERVEILRGPQGTLYGASSQGGTIRYITNKPDTNDFEGEIAGRAGLRARDGGMRLEGNAMLNLPLVQDLLAVRAVGYVRHVDGFVDLPALGLDGTDVEKTHGGRVQVALTPGPDTTITAMGLYQNTELEDTSRVLATADFRGNPVIEPYEDELKLFNLTVEQRFDFGTFTGTFSTYRRNSFFVFDQSQFVAPRWGSINQTGQLDSTSGEFRFSSDFKGPFQVVAGLFYEKRDFEGVSAGYYVDPDEGLPARPPEPFFVQPSEQFVRNSAAFVNATFDVTDRLTAEAGIRFYKMKRRNETELVLDVFGRPLGPQPTQRAKSDGNVKRFQLSYEINDDVLVYGIFSEGFREGGPNAPGLLGNYPLAFDPDLVKNYEAGWKSTFLDRQLLLNGALYYMTWDDIQVAQRDPTGAFVYTSNAGKADLKGAELEGRISPHSLQGFTANFAVRYSDQKLTEDNPLVVGPPPNPNAGREGERIPFTSKFSGNLGMEQKFEVQGLDMFARADISYIGSAYTTFSRTDPLRRKVGDYALVDLRLGVEEGGWDASLYVRNLFNERAFTNWTIESRPGIPDRVLTTDPREVGIQAAYRF
ncbi:TonB-dependent receptor [Sphingosinicella rhizophila]|uniref:TonB-dependent receptor n=1 Tax=Sphingosinicella rhizophila TaxID=3050082 RepID=A0ABU3Q8T4_9SPHN|nr:TonB-dependent receptor [Sphingosinicella sp. GR2756]MDT9599811.1 TonB-dependent receptor [Sphingosinicella sp. GR2756]